MPHIIHPVGRCERRSGAGSLCSSSAFSSRSVVSSHSLLDSESSSQTGIPVVAMAAGQNLEPKRLPQADGCESRKSQVQPRLATVVPLEKHMLLARLSHLST